jgi:putative membrane protein
MHDSGGWWMLFGGIMMFIFGGGIIALTIWGITRITKRDGSTTTHNSDDIAKQRYARGEINKEEFDQIKKDILD